MEAAKVLAKEGHPSKDPARGTTWSPSTPANCKSSTAIYPGTEADPKVQKRKSTRLDAWAPKNPAHSTGAELDERKPKCHRYGLAFNKLSGYF